ncbi:cdc42 effector protein 1b [Nerophis lumbriciformis]|uniref:cdc42 effector protein 1b n=1 Tax=Nerophis lumbriciformis TaxID=546530 RepID=UPI002ADF7E73|nr:cdc42 effector protein 1-like [Nerophis lumbriciformis]XP_061830458.1 cdc42 effector protein 1-like [Nerophis lumbriciformis]XP_061830459.1 cdc42 effector protein 1-like [Nerophis lumbriciformis]
MSRGKRPGIKGLVSGSQERRRFKGDLSVDMISPPMGDFRHTMHVGRGGDVFGDTSFLSNYGGAKEPGSPDSAHSSKSNGFFTRTFRHIRKNSGPRGEARDFSSPPPDISPIIKNAISLPQLNLDSPNGSLQRLTIPNSISSTDGSICTYGLQSGFVTLPRFSRPDKAFPDGDVLRRSVREHRGKAPTRSDSLTSFSLDLGPSLMTEVLGLLDQRTAGEEEDGSSTTETFVSPGASSTNSPRRNAKGQEDPRSTSWTQEDRSQEDPRSTSWTQEDRSQEDPRSTSWTQEEDRSPHTSPARAEPAMESERFQKAADVLSRHYGGGAVKRSFSKTSYTFSEEEEEIKV